MDLRHEGNENRRSRATFRPAGRVFGTPAQLTRLIASRVVARIAITSVLIVCAVATSASAALRVPVRQGDTLSAIAARHGVSVASLAQANGIRDVHVLSVGRSLTVRSGLRRSAPNGVTSTLGTYTVRRGDTLSAIAVRFGVGVGALVRQNGLGSAHMIMAGMRLRVPASGGVRQATWVGGGSVHVVRSGDTLGAIAARYATNAASLARANGIRNPNVLVVGTRVRVPTGSGPQTGAVQPVTAATHGWGDHPSKATVASLLASHSARHGVDVALARAVAWQESGWWQGARSSTGAIGVMQLMPGTATWIGQALLGRSINAFDASDNVDAGVAYLAYLQRQTGSRRLALASYYQGLSSVTSRGMLPETEAYVGSVTSFVGKV